MGRPAEFGVLSLRRNVAACAGERSQSRPRPDLTLTTPAATRSAHSPSRDIMKIFWSWQSDTPPAIGRDFVKSALKEAVEQLAEEVDLSEAERPELDHDTKDVPGLAPTADTIFKKIDGAALFVADLSLTGSTPGDEKRTPNPNVLTELG